ncbi:PASTA domain-containing protein [Acidobacteriota bacterium]
MLAKTIYKYVSYALLFLNLFFLSAVISFQISLKGEMVTLPDLSGNTLAESKAILTGKKLYLVQSGLQLSNRWESGKVISQEPLAGSKIKINKIVKVILSAGKEKVIVPQLTGKNIQAVTQILKDLGLRKGKISHVHTPKYAAGKIIAQHPFSFDEVAKNSPISLLVSQGENEKKYLMPDLIGKKATAVIAKLKELDFRVGDVRYSFYPGLEPGIIIKQFPPLGFRIQKRNLITLEVSK